MRTKKFAIAVILGIFLMCSVFNLSAQNKEVKVIRETQLGKGKNAFTESLKLTDEQKTKMAEMKLYLQKDMLQLKNQLGEKMARLRTLETADKPDMGDINKVIDEMSVIKATMAKKMAAQKQDIRKMLTDKQRIAFDAKGGKMQKEKKDRMKGGKKNIQVRVQHTGDPGMTREIIEQKIEK